MNSSDDWSPFWLGKLANLNVGRPTNGGIPPHKPILLLSIMDLIERGLIRDRWVAYNADLVTGFRHYWPHVYHRRRNQPDITLPFNALGGDRDQVWTRFDEHGNPSKSKLTTRLCELDAHLYVCLQDPDFRDQARRLLIATYFTAPEQISLCSHFGFPVPETAELATFQQDREAFKARQKKGRDSRFRYDVGNGYLYTCALTGYRLESTLGYIVQACHIQQHAKSGIDHPGNGLALTPDAHWMFDKGLWTIIPNGDVLLIHVARDRFTESSPEGETLARYHGRPLHLHSMANLRPMLEHLQWHRNHHGIEARRD
jgi:putative restriction endonuclease